MEEQKILNLATLEQWVTEWVYSCRRNKQDPSEVEVLISVDNRSYRPFNGFLTWNSKGAVVGIRYYESDILRFEPKDERPPVGEYWTSRGPSSYDVSGFVSSKPAGDRLMRMVRYILETDTPKTFLDYREFEPNWIQFKFSAEEFDVARIDELARANGDIITEQIVRACVKDKRQEG